jgi:hypothetical protein
VVYRTIMDQPLTLAKKTIEDLYAKYADNPYMFAKTHNYVCFQLPAILENIQKTHTERQTRNDQLVSEQDSFIHSFLNSNQYFYSSTTERFFHYDGLHYHVFTEDAILHHVLTTITRERNQLMCRKPQTKVYIMKRIKENLLLKTIPESATIQGVLEALVPAVFAKKSEAKYFLTVVGDNLLKKVDNQNHFVSPKAKPFLKELATISQLLIGQNPAASFKHKYYEHAYSDCRLIKVQDTVAQEHVWRPIIQTYGLDLLCVAAHYSHRYESGDTFLTNDDVLAEYVLYLAKNTPRTLVQQFIDEYLQLLRKDRAPSLGEEDRKPSDPASHKTCSWTNMQYLWRQFLQSKHLPGVMFQNTLKTNLTDHLGDRYDAVQDTFLDTTSKYLPAVQRFLAFWESTMTSSPDTLAEYEVDEIGALYKQWCGSGVVPLNDTKILDLIRFYYPTVEIEGDKYIQNIRCRLWDKPLDIQVALSSLKETNERPLSLLHPDEISGIESFAPASSTKREITVYDAYAHYRKFYEGKKLLVSKVYFERYLQDAA